jgi:hypothetical protein
LLSPRLLLANYLLFSLFNSKFYAKSWLVLPEAMQSMRPPYSSTGHRVSLLCKRKYGGWVTQIFSHAGMLGDFSDWHSANDSFSTILYAINYKLSIAVQQYTFNPQLHPVLCLSVLCNH